MHDCNWDTAHLLVEVTEFNTSLATANSLLFGAIDL